MPDRPALDTLRACATDAARRSRSPYSGRAEGAALLLADGAWIAGARVENAAFPLTIPAAVSAVVAAYAAGRAAATRALALTHPLRAGEAASIAAALADVLAPQGLALVAVGPDVLAVDGPLPSPAGPLPLALGTPRPETDRDGIALARLASRYAHVPASNFPVGCVVETTDGRLFIGANIEHDDWTRGLCAERTALATAVSAGATGFRRIWLVCPLAPDGTPCGACRQVMAELAPGVPVVMARGDALPELTTPEALLPGAFTGAHLRG